MSKLSLICFLFNKRLDEIGVKVDDIEAQIMIESNCIESIRQRMEDGADFICEKTCMVHMKSGDSYVIKMDFKRMLKLWIWE